MILIFDLDDTLYDERTYVESGFQAVALFGKEHFGWNEEESFGYLLQNLDKYGRGAIFDWWLKRNNTYTKKLVKTCVSVYRHHAPKISLDHQTKSLLNELKYLPLYIVTDGHKIVQEKKITALNISQYFRHVFITHRYGIRNAKPGTYCFDLIRKREACGWHDMVYIGDDPTKDFVNLNIERTKTVRVHTGRHKNIKAKFGFDAAFHINDLGGLKPLLDDWGVHASQD